MTASPVRLETLVHLPSEASVHFLNFLALTLLACAYTVLLPAYAILFGEGRWFAGVLFCVCLLVGVVVSAIGWFRFLTRNTALEEFPSGSESTLQAMMWEQFNQIFGSRSPIPRLCWSPLDTRVAARVAGRSKAPTLIVGAGLVAKLKDAPDVVRFYLAHECAHLGQADLELLAATQALQRAWISITILTCTVSVWLLAPALIGAGSRALIMLVSTIWIATLLVVGIAIARYASVVVAFRELDADVRALSLRPEMQLRLSEVFGAMHARSWLQRVKSLLSPRITHLSSAERLMFLTDLQRLLLPKFRYFALVAILLMLLQSSPFLTGYGYTTFRVALLLPWSVACLAYCASISRCATGFALEHRPFNGWLVTQLTASAALLLLIPSLLVDTLFMGLLTLLSGDTVMITEAMRQFVIGARNLVISPWSYLFLLLLAMNIRISGRPGRGSLRIGGWATGLLCAGVLLSIERLEVEHLTRMDAMTAWLHSNSMFSQAVGVAVTLVVFGVQNLGLRRKQRRGLRSTRLAP